MLQLPLNVQLDDSSRFDNYFVADNRQLVSRLRALDGGSSDLIYCWGASETGKTHLAQAVCHQFGARDLAAAYLPLDNPALSPEVLQGMTVMDLVCIDNLNAVVGDKAWEVALFDLYNNLKLENKNLVIFADDAPGNLAINLKDLQSRLSAMEIYRLQGLDDSQKTEFFVNRALNRGLHISDDVASFILSRYSRSVADLMIILDKLDHGSIALKRKVTIPLVKQIFDE